MRAVEKSHFFFLYGNNAFPRDFKVSVIVYKYDTFARISVCV